MSRKPIRPARKAPTATSLAAFSTVGAVPPARRASASEAAAPENAHRIRRLEGQPRDRAEVEARGRGADPLRPAQGVGDRDAHVRPAELGEHRAVAEGDQAVHDRFRMDQDLDLVRVQAEQVMGLDQLEALVHHGRAIDRDLGAHGPVGMGDRLARGVTPAISARVQPRNGPPDAVRISRSTLSVGSPRSAWKIALCSESTGSSTAPLASRPRPSGGRRRRPGTPCWPARPWRRGAPRRASDRARPRRRSPP